MTRAEERSLMRQRRRLLSAALLAVISFVVPGCGTSHDEAKQAPQGLDQAFAGGGASAALSETAAAQAPAARLNSDAAPAQARGSATPTATIGRGGPVPVATPAKGALTRSSPASGGGSSVESRKDAAASGAPAPEARDGR